MNKQDLRYSYLGYFASQYAKKEDIDFDTLEDMAAGDSNLEREVLKELINEGLLEGIEVYEDEHHSKITQYKGKIKLTTKGIKEILNLFPSEKNEIINDIKSETKIKNTNTISIDSIHEKLLQEIRRNSEFKSNKANTTKIRTIFNKTVGSRYKAEKAIAKLKTDGYINFSYHDDIALFCPDNLLTDKAIKFLDEANEKRMHEAISNIGKPKPTTQEILEEMGVPKKVREYIKEVEDRVKNEEEEKKRKDTPSITFSGILGQNCGEVIAPSGEDERRIQERGFKVKNGIYVLRGFAKASTIARASIPEYQYQRKINDPHQESLERYIKNMKTSAKYLPEVTLVCRRQLPIIQKTLPNSLTDTQKGEILNQEYYSVKVKEHELYRIDGNHRIEAALNIYQQSLATHELNPQEKIIDLYLPFAIILWTETQEEDGELIQNVINLDDEAFLFYFLNSKSKKLTTEENLKGLVNAQTWTDYELKNANVLLPYIKDFKENFEEHKLFQKEYYKDREGRENTKIQIMKILEIILDEERTNELSFDLDIFGDYISKTQEILSQRDRFKYLREHFRCFPQFVFYTLYKYSGNTESSIEFINEVNKWAEYYKHDSNSFTLPNKMYYNAQKQLDKKINIFVAMPYYDKATVEQFNKTMQGIVDELKEENINLKDKLNLYPIMTYKAESTDILANMDKQIGECDILIADISNHGDNKVNPNVMFELGRVYNQKKFILIRNKDNDINNSAFDIKHIDYIPIDFGMGFDTSIKNELKPRILNITKNILGFC